MGVAGKVPRSPRPRFARADSRRAQITAAGRASGTGLAMPAAVQASLPGFRALLAGCIPDEPRAGEGPEIRTPVLRCLRCRPGRLRTGGRREARRKGTLPVADAGHALAVGRPHVVERASDEWQPEGARDN